MKAVVMEIRAGYAALLQEDGIVVKQRNRNFTVGDVVNIERNSGKRVSAIVAAAAMFVLLLGGGGLAYAAPYYYVSLDVNPSILIEVNRFERVIGVEAVNEDAATVLVGLNLRNMHIEEAVGKAVARIKDAGYLGEEAGNIAIASTAKNTDKAMRLSDKLKQAVDEEIRENGVEAGVLAKVTGYEMVQRARELGITPGRLNIITNLLGEEVGEENINEPIKDLMARYTASKKAQNRERIREATGCDDEEAGERLEKEGSNKQNTVGNSKEIGSGKPVNEALKQNRGDRGVGKKQGAPIKKP